MPIIEISDLTFSMLQRLAIPLTDDIDTVIHRLSDAAIRGVAYELPSIGSIQPHNPENFTALMKSSSSVQVTLEEAKDLTHTKLISATFDGVKLEKASWSSLAKFAHERAFEKLGSFEALQLATHAHLKVGQYEQEGFMFLSKNRFSIQGMDSNMAWNNCLRLAKELKTSIFVQFEWRNHPKAARPGERGQLSFEP
ncbi:MAG: hypothetical protein ABIY70_07980 [Capsulimonas sp.]|uniref:T4SS efffector SepA family protein n=1 Tax=Capsulimonas sp. TaxID=2494211 RepID=UPI0032649E8B